MSKYVSMYVYNTTTRMWKSECGRFFFSNLGLTGISNTFIWRSLKKKVLRWYSVSALNISVTTRKKTPIGVAQHMCGPAWFFISYPWVCVQVQHICIHVKQMYCLWVCVNGPEFRESSPMEIGQFSLWGVLWLLWKRRWRFLLVLAQPVNGACLLPSITELH